MFDTQILVRIFPGVSRGMYSLYHAVILLITILLSTDFVQVLVKGGR